MEVGKVGFRTGRTIQRLDVGGELDQVAGDKAGSQAEVAQDLHQQPGGVTAGAGALGQGLLRRLHAGLHADGVANVLLQLGIEGNEKINAALLCPRDRCHVFIEQFAACHLIEIGRQLVPLPVFVGERKLLGVRLKEEIEGIDDRHLGHQIDFDPEFARLLREDQPGQVVALWILLPVDEVLFGPDLE